MFEKKDIRLTKTINRHLLFRDSSHTLSANRFRAYHSPWRWHLLFKSSSHMLLANKFRVYYLPKRRAAVCSDLLVLLFLKKHILFLKKSTWSIFFALTHLCFQQNFRKKWAKQLISVKRSVLFTYSKFSQSDRLQPHILFDNKHVATPHNKAH